MFRNAYIFAAAAVVTHDKAFIRQPQLQSQEHGEMVCRPSELPIYGSIRPKQ